MEDVTSSCYILMEKFSELLLIETCKTENISNGPINLDISRKEVKSVNLIFLP